jgi:hypothetical protein
MEVITVHLSVFIICKPSYSIFPANGLIQIKSDMEGLYQRSADKCQFGPLILSLHDSINFEFTKLCCSTEPHDSVIEYSLMEHKLILQCLCCHNNTVNFTHYFITVLSHTLLAYENKVNNHAAYEAVHIFYVQICQWVCAFRTCVAVLW